MKRKLLLLTAAILCAVGSQKLHAAAIDYLTGWTEVTSLPTSNDDLGQYYYVFVSTDADLMMAQEWGSGKLGSTQEGQLTMVYRTPANPLSHKTMVWTLEYNDTYKYGIRNLNKSTHLMQSRKYEGGDPGPWNVQFAWETSQSQWTQWDFTYANEAWTIKNLLSTDNGGGDNYYVGPWSSKAFADNNVVAGNKSGDEVGHFKIYRMLRTTYNSKNVTATYLTNASFESSVFKEDQYNNNTVSGWTITKKVSGNDSRLAAGTQTESDGHMGYVGSNVKPTDGDYYLSLRGRWHDKSSQEGCIVSQAFTSLPKGNYTLTADYQLFINASGKGSATFTLETNGGSYLNTQDATVGTTASANVTNWNTHKPYTVSFDFDYMSGTTTFKMDFANTANAQILLDNVNLIYNSNYTDALRSAIARATAMNTRKETSALTTAISTAQSVLDGVTNLIDYQGTIDAAVTALNTAIATAWSDLKDELASGEDITYLVENPSFEYSTPVSSGVVTTIKDAKSNNTAFGWMQYVSGWTMAVDNGDNHASGVYAYGGTPWLGGSGYTAPTADPNDNTGKALGIIAVWTSTTQYKQNITLPAGRYVITLPIYNKTGGTTEFSKNLFGFIEDGGTEHLAKAKTYTVNDWTTETIEFDLDIETSGYLSLGYTAVNSGSGQMPHLFVDGLTITYILADAEDYAALNSAIETAEAKTLGFENGDYAPYNNIDALTKLAAAKAINQSAANTKTSVETATANLTDATWTANEGSVNAIYNWNMAVTDGTNPKGWTREGESGDLWGQQVTPSEGYDFSSTSNNTAWYYNHNDRSLYGSTGLYTMPLKASTMYELKVKYCSQGTEGGGLITSLKATIQKGSDTPVMNQNELGGNSTRKFEEKKVYFTTTDAGNYVLTLANIGNFYFTDVSITKVTEVNINVAAGKWGTFIAPFDVTIPANISAYTATGVINNRVTLDAVTTTIPANTPVLLKNDTEDAVAETFYGISTATEDSYTEGLLTGVYTAATIPAGEHHYILQTQPETGQAFYLVETAFTATPYKCYLTYNAGSLVKFLGFDFGDATGITEITEKTEGTESLFDLSGRRVSKAQKGLYIMNGKKVMVK